jgi:acyl-CoA thioesterase
MLFTLDVETALMPLGNGVFQRPVTEFFWNHENAFGGWAIAQAVEAVTLVAEPELRLASINAVFVEAIGLGELFVFVTPLSQRRRTGFFRIVFRKDSETGPVVFAADVIMGNRPETDLAYATPAPEAPAPDTLEQAYMPMGPKWFGHFDQRLVEGEYFTVNPRPRNLVWIKEDDNRPVDAKSLALISDTPIPRTFLMGTEPRRGSTVSYSFHLYASDAELKAVGADYVLMQGDTDRVVDGKLDQRALIWSPDGTLLAISEQMAFFR